MQKNNTIVFLLFVFTLVAHSQQPRWRLAKGSEGIAIYDIDIYRPNPDTMYAKGSKWLMSTDKGETWTERYSWSAYGVLKVHPSNSKIIYENEQSSGTSSNDFFITHLDTGATKIFSGRGIPSFALAVDYMDKKTVFVGVADYLLRTKEGYPDKDVTPPGGRVINIAIAPSNDSILVAVCEGDVYKSTDKGMSWTSIRYGGVPLYSAIHPKNPNVIAVGYQSHGAEPRGIQMTMDGGITWLPRYNGIDTATPFRVNQVTFDNKNSNNLFSTVSRKGAYCSSDMGVTWNRVGEGVLNNNGVTTIVLDTLNNRMYFGMYSSDTSIINGVYICDYEPTTIKDKPCVISLQFHIYQNYPNPFNPTTTITYALPQDGLTILKVYDALGREVAELVNAFKQTGRYTASFDASRLSSGVYIYKLMSGKYIASKKMMLVK